MPGQRPPAGPGMGGLGNGCAISHEAPLGCPFVVYDIAPLIFDVVADPGQHAPLSVDDPRHAGAVAACHWLFAGRMFAYPATGVPFPGDALAFKASNEPCPEALNRRSGCAATARSRAAWRSAVARH